MASKVDIFNSALGHLGLDPVSSPTENNKRARTINAQYEFSRQALLRGYVWNFAKVRLNLAPDATAPAFGFTNRFLLPQNILYFLGVYDESEIGYQINYTGARIPFKVEGRYVLCDLSVLLGFGIKDVTDPTQFDPLFTYALVWLLVKDCAGALTSDAGDFSGATMEFDKALSLAKARNAMEGTPEAITVSEWEDARQGYGGGKYGPRGGPGYW